MNQRQHQWATFYSPRNGRISIQACDICGLAKSFFIGSHECTEVTDKTKAARLRGWSKNVVLHSDDHSLDIGK